jgi:metal-responsive CopG/Arc/MetJ family transcriptional regulator
MKEKAMREDNGREDLKEIVSIGLPQELVDLLDSYCRDNCMTRSQLVQAAVNEVLNRKKAAPKSARVKPLRIL